MLPRIIGAIGLAGGFLLGCGSSRPPFEKRVADYGACHDDGDCISAFCDRTVCVPLRRRGEFGGECDPRPPPRLPDARSQDRGCGQFLCIEGRCRACDTDQDCEAYGAGGKCEQTRGVSRCTGSPAREPRKDPPGMLRVNGEPSRANHL